MKAGGGKSYNFPPLLKTARAENELFAFQCGQWELIRSFVALWSKSWKCFTALHSIQLYIYISCLNCVIWSWASGQVSHAFLSMPNFCQLLYDFFIMLLLLLCSITPQHIYVVVVVVVYYTSGTTTTTRFIEIDYEVCVK